MRCIPHIWSQAEYILLYWNIEKLHANRRIKRRRLLEKRPRHKKKIVDRNRSCFTPIYHPIEMIGWCHILTYHMWNVRCIPRPNSQPFISFFSADNTHTHTQSCEEYYVTPHRNDYGMSHSRCSDGPKEQQQQQPKTLTAPDLHRHDSTERWILAEFTYKTNYYPMGKNVQHFNFISSAGAVSSHERYSNNTQYNSTHSHIEIDGNV